MSRLQNISVKNGTHFAIWSDLLNQYHAQVFDSEEAANKGAQAVAREKPGVAIVVVRPLATYIVDGLSVYDHGSEKSDNTPDQSADVQQTKDRVSLPIVSA